MAKWKEYFFNEEQLLEVLMLIYNHKGVHQQAFKRYGFLNNLGKYYKENKELTPKQKTALKRKAIVVYTLGHAIADWNNRERKVE